MILKVPWSTSLLCLAASTHRAGRLCWGTKTQGVRAWDGLPLERRGGGVRGSNLSAVVLYPKKALHH